MLPKKRPCCDFVDGNVLLWPPSKRPKYHAHRNNTVTYCQSCDDELYETKDLKGQQVVSPFQCFFCMFWHAQPTAYSSLHLNSNSLLLVYGDSVVHSRLAIKLEGQYCWPITSLRNLETSINVWVRHDHHRTIREKYQEFADNRVEMDYACLDILACKQRQALTKACLYKVVQLLCLINSLTSGYLFTQTSTSTLLIAGSHNEANESPSLGFWAS